MAAISLTYASAQSSAECCVFFCGCPLGPAMNAAPRLIFSPAVRLLPALPLSVSPMALRRFRATAWLTLTRAVAS